MRRTPISLASLLALAPGLARADTVHLTDGTTLEGRVVDLGEEVRVQRGPGAVTVPKGRVVRITFGPTLEAQYAERAASLRPDEAERHFRLGEWCREVGLSAQARGEYEKAAAAAPDHEGAHRALGHEKVGDRWLTFEEAQEARGLVLHKGTWMAPEERDVRAALEEADALRRAALLEIRRLLRRAASTRSEERADARKRLAAFSAEERRKPCLEALADAAPGVRAAAAAELATAGDARSTAPLARRVVMDDAKEVREAALQTLLARRDPATGEAFLVIFLGGNVTARRRAAEGLALFPDRRAVPALIPALESALAPPPEISLTTSGPGGDAPGPIIIPGGVAPAPPAARAPAAQPGGARPAAPGATVPYPGGLANGQLPPPRVIVLPKVITSLKAPVDPAEEAARKALAESLVRALRACSGGQDFGEDVDRWKAWWIKAGGRR